MSPECPEPLPLICRTLLQIRAVTTAGVVVWVPGWASGRPLKEKVATVPPGLFPKAPEAGQFWIGRGDLVSRDATGLNLRIERASSAPPLEIWDN